MLIPVLSRLLYWLHKLSFPLVALLLIVVVLYRLEERARSENVDINQRTVNLTSIKEIQELHVARYIISNRQPIVFNEDDTPDIASTVHVKEMLLAAALDSPMISLYQRLYQWLSKPRYVDFVGVMAVDAVVPMDTVRIEHAAPSTLCVTVNEIRIKRGNIYWDRSFFWESNNPPSNASNVAANRAETEIFDELTTYIRYEDLRKDVNSFFACFFGAAGFRVSVKTPDHWTIDMSGLSTNPMFDRLKGLAKKYKSDFSNDRWHVDPEIPPEKFKRACQYDEFKSLKAKAPCILLFDTKGDGRAGLIVTSEGIFWRNGYWWSSDSDKRFLTWNELAGATLTSTEESSRIIFELAGKEVGCFFDSRDITTTPTVLAFLKELQTTIKNLPAPTLPIGGV